MAKLLPVDAVPLFPPLARELVSFLRALAPGDWERRTVLPTWRVKDIAAHLLDTALRRLSAGRDGYRPPGPAPAIRDYADLVRHVGSIADEWVATFRRVSPATLVDLLEHVEPRLHGYFSGLDPAATARTSVAWAGERQSAVWFDVAREYTERWHHQMQIRDAFGDLAIQSPQLYRPVLETWMRALPHHYRGVDAAGGTTVRITVAGEAGSSWYLRREADAWQLSLEPQGAEAAFAEVRQESAWKILTRYGRETVAPGHVRTGGEEALARHVLSMVCIIA
jgi:uncharacterized protein (TIGR03083 family)